MTFTTVINLFIILIKHRADSILINKLILFIEKYSIFIKLDTIIVLWQNQSIQS